MDHRINLEFRGTTIWTDHQKRCQKTESSFHVTMECYQRRLLSSQRSHVPLRLLVYHNPRKDHIQILQKGLSYISNVEWALHQTLLCWSPLQIAWANTLPSKGNGHIFWALEQRLNRLATMHKDKEEVFGVMWKLASVNSRRISTWAQEWMVLKGWPKTGKFLAEAELHLGKDWKYGK